LWLLFATQSVILLAYKFGAPDFAPGEWLHLRTLASDSIPMPRCSDGPLALVGLATTGARSCGSPLYSARLAWIGLVLFNVAALAGTIALDLGYSAGSLGVREWPWPIRAISWPRWQ